MSAIKISALTSQGQHFEATLSGDSFVLGRSPQCHFPISIDGLSRRHCQIDIKDGAVYLTDLESTNGVTVNEQKIPANKPYRYDLYLPLSIGPLTSVTIEMLDATQANSRPDSIIASKSAAPASASRSSEQTATRKMTTPKAITNKSKAANKKVNKKAASYYLNIIIALAVMLGGVFFFFQMQGNEAAAPDDTGFESSPVETPSSNDGPQF